jgi:predicted amidohydrolase
MPSSDETLRVATCQFPVCGDARANGRYVRRFMRRAAAQGADVVHLSEAALSGYGGWDVPDFGDYDWEALRLEMHAIQSLSDELSLWVILGSAHYLCAGEKPTNCLYVIDPRGEIVDRYDKSMLTGGDEDHYTAGDHLVTLMLKGIMCGLAICYDNCYPEVYNAYRHAGVEVMFHSFYNARFDGPNILDVSTPAQIRCRAMDNVMWVAANNSSARHSCWATRFVRPDGSIAGQLKRHVAGMLVHDFPDPELVGWIHNLKMMKLAPDEVLHNGSPSDHPRAKDRRSLP